jgi:transcriptional regulator GlxA family with amidase domain
VQRPVSDGEFAGQEADVTVTVHSVKAKEVPGLDDDFALAARANMSGRTFARRFVQGTGTTPQRWLIGRRILLAQQLADNNQLSFGGRLR